MDDSGAKTIATVVWKAKNSNRIESERTDTDEQKLARSYLDDGGGNLVTVPTFHIQSTISMSCSHRAAVLFIGTQMQQLTGSATWEPVGSGSQNHGLAIPPGRNATGEESAIISKCRV